MILHFKTDSDKKFFSINTRTRKYTVLPPDTDRYQNFISLWFYELRKVEDETYFNGYDFAKSWDEFSRA